MYLPLLCLLSIQTDSLVEHVAQMHGSMLRRYLPISAASMVSMPYQWTHHMLMGAAHSHILLCVRNPSEVKLERQEEVHAALCLLHVLFPLQLCDLKWWLGLLQLHECEAETQ